MHVKLSRPASFFKNGPVFPEWFRLKHSFSFVWCIPMCFGKGPFWIQSPALSEKIGKWFCVGTKPSFAFMHFESQPLNLSHKLPFPLFLSLLYFPFNVFSAALKVIDSAIYQRIYLRKKAGRNLEGLFTHIQWQEVVSGLLGPMCLCLISTIYADHK